jgi:hypothetical protein
VADSAAASWSTALSGAAVFMLALWRAAATREVQERPHDVPAAGVPADRRGEVGYRRGSGGVLAAVVVVFAAMVAIVWLGFWAFDAGDDFDAGVTVEQVAERPALLAGRGVVLLGEVEEIGERAFVLEGEDGSEVVVATNRSIPELDEDELVQVFGVVRDRDNLPRVGDLGEDAGEGAVRATFIDPNPLL